MCYKPIISISMQDIVCHICSSGEDESKMLLCDNCNRGFHTYCLNIRSVPSGSWYCARCARSSTTTTTSSTTSTSQPLPKEVHVYIRVSSAKQNAPEFGRVGMDTQNVEILKFCVAHNLYVKSCITEIGSAFHTNTPKLRKLITKIQPNVPIMVYSFNRFSRNVVHATEMANALHEKESYIWSVTDQMTSKNPAFESLIQAAENESRLSGQRIASVHQRVISQGGFVGKKPFGYNKVRVNGVFKLQENVLEQKIMKKIFEMSKTTIHFTQIFAFAIKKYPRYDWTPKMITDCMYDVVRNSHSQTIIPAPTSEMEELINAIEEVEVEEEVPEIYVVKRFHKIRVNSGIFEIMVEWEGLSNKGPNCSCTWENVVSLYEDVPDLVTEYLNKSKSAYVPLIRDLLS